MGRDRGIWYEHRITEKWIENYPECSVFQQLKKHSEEYHSLPALDFQGRKYSYKDTVETTEKLAAALYAYGIKKAIWCQLCHRISLRRFLCFMQSTVSVQLQI